MSDTNLDHRTIDWAVDIIGMCEPIRCNQGGMWFSRNHNFADATFVDYGAADAFAAKALPVLVDALKVAREAIWSGGDTVAAINKIDMALAMSLEGRGGAT